MLTKSERQIMELLWKVDTPLTATEIVNLSIERSWKSSYIHLLLNSLIKKRMIEVIGMKQTTKNFARTFQARLSKEEYLVVAMNNQQPLSPNSLPYLVSTLINKTEDNQLISDLEEIIQKRKDELK